MVDPRPPSPPRPMLTTDAVRVWLDERATQKAIWLSSGAKIEALDARLSALKTLFDETALRDMLGDDVADEIEAALSGERAARQAEAPKKGPSPASSKSDRREWIVDLLLSEERGLKDTEILEKSAGEPWTAQSPETVRTIRELVENRARRGKLRRRGDFIYHPDILRRIEEGDLQERDGGAAGPKHDIKAIVRNALAILGPSPAKAVIGQMWKMPEAKPILERNATYPYNILSRMALAGELDRVGNIYSLPSDADGVEAQRSPSAPRSLFEGEA